LTMAKGSPFGSELRAELLRLLPLLLRKKLRGRIDESVTNVFKE
jgi:hypothetical protein